MLNGIGGNTIEQAKENISESEFKQWQEYIRIFGSLNPSIHINHSSGRLAYVVQAVQGGKMGLEDFLPNYNLKENGDE